VSNAFLSHAGGAACPPPMYVGSHSLPERAVPHRCRTSRRVIGRRAVRIFKESTSSKNLRHQSRPVPGTGQHRLRSRAGSLSLGTPRFLRVTTPHTRAHTHHTRTHAHTHTRTHTRTHSLRVSSPAHLPETPAHRRRASPVAEGNSLFAAGKHMPSYPIPAEALHAVGVLLPKFQRQ